MRIPSIEMNTGKPVFFRQFEMVVKYYSIVIAGRNRE